MAEAVPAAVAVVDPALVVEAVTTIELLLSAAVEEAWAEAAEVLEGSTVDAADWSEVTLEAAAVEEAAEDGDAVSF